MVLDQVGKIKGQQQCLTLTNARTQSRTKECKEEFGLEIWDKVVRRGVMDPYGQLPVAHKVLGIQNALT